MKRRIFIYVIITLGITAGYFPLSSLLFKPAAVEAQCVQYLLDSCQGRPGEKDCPCPKPGCFKAEVGGQVQSGNTAGWYGDKTWNTVLCVCP